MFIFLEILLLFLFGNVHGRPRFIILLLVVPADDVAHATKTTNTPRLQHFCLFYYYYVSDVSA